jgi:hypothetical protein
VFAVSKNDVIAAGIHDRYALCLEAGYSGFGDCKIPHCIAQNRLAPASNFNGVGTPYQLGRVVSQAEGLSVPAMPWAPQTGGCVWPLVDYDGLLKSGIVQFDSCSSHLWTWSPIPYLPWATSCSFKQATKTQNSFRAVRLR